MQNGRGTSYGGTHVLKMIGYIESLEKLGVELATDVILQSLTNSFSQIVLNFNMNEINKTLPQLLSMLRIAKSHMKKVGPKPIMIVRKDKAKGKLDAKESLMTMAKPNLTKERQH
ncbi:hypothetical protein PVK06_007993 [Gossypium arboreum]|uniref:Uncharacterized protein n=1 Tax=Gossypium arboreum TaxID=29729 RepID=A0ABR0QJ15_GOSAR|nr:hypothetical protein PVK06_007993 [Gossypium arboreum]